MRWRLVLAALGSALALGGCASLMSNATASLGRDLTAGILNQDDPETVAEGLPAYLLLLDGLIEGDPANPDLLLAAAKLYGAYAGGFVEPPERRRALAVKSLDYARRATCAESKPLCGALDADFAQFDAVVADIGADTLPLAYALGSSWAGVIQAEADDLDRIAELPKV